MVLLFSTPEEETSAPEQGTYMATISARYKGEVHWERVYTFVITEVKNKM